VAGLTASQVDRLGERLRERVTPEDLALLREYREGYRETLESVVDEVRTIAATVGAASLATRPAKTTRSIIAKLSRERTRLSRMQDIAGCRLVVELLLDQDAVVAALAARHPDWRVVDRRADPRHGYRAVHLVTAPPRCVEVQVRTVLQETWASGSERLERRWEGIKYGLGPEKVVELQQAWSARLAELESSGQLTREMVGDRKRLARLLEDMLEDL
jgi:ppGpp synthetase/RelA/SpoT-type nucleotidyltranferase